MSGVDASGGRHRGEPSDKPYEPPEPGPDGSGPGGPDDE